jgi:Protein of unknown function (DUF3572)
MPMRKFDRESPQAEEIAVKALGFIAGDEEAFERFVALTGLGLSDIKERAADPDFLAGVLDFLLQDEGLLVRFAESEGIPPELPASARRKLPGGGQNAEW